MASNESPKDTKAAAEPAPDSIKLKIDVGGEVHRHVAENGDVTTTQAAHAEGSMELELGPVKASAGAGASEETAHRVTHDTQGTHMLVSGDVTTWVEASAKAIGYGVATKQEHGTKGTYEVNVPPPYKVDPETINPLDLTGLPTGTTIVIDSSKHGNDVSSVTFGKPFGGVEVAGGFKTEDGAVMHLEKTAENTVRVSVTSNDQTNDTPRVTLPLGPSGLVTGRDGEMKLSTTSTAEFDLSTPGGREAYGRFIVDREFPRRDGDGVANVATVQTMNIDSQPRVGLKKLGEVDAGIHGHQSYTLVQNQNQADITFNYELQNVVSAKSTYPLDRNGQPDLAHGTDFSVSIPHLNRDKAGALRMAFGGERDLRGLDNEQKVELHFTGEQLMQLHERCQEYLRLHPDHGTAPMAQDAAMVAIAGAKNPQQVFNALLTNDARFLADDLTRLDVGLPSPKAPLPGAVQIEPPAVMSAKMAGMSEGDREALMNRLYRAPASTAPPVRSETSPAIEPGHPAPSSEYARTPTNPAKGLHETGHPDHAMYKQALTEVHRIDGTLGRAPDASSERFAASLVVASRRQGMNQIDHVVLDAEGQRAYAVQGELNSPLKRVAEVDTAQAVQTPVAQSTAQLSQAAQARNNEQAMAAPVTTAPVPHH